MILLDNFKTQLLTCFSTVISVFFDIIFADGFLHVTVSVLLSRGWVMKKNCKKINVSGDLTHIMVYYDLYTIPVPSKISVVASMSRFGPKIGFVSLSI